MKNEQQIISKQRTRDHGEVYTAEREVDAMLDLVKNETDQIESRFLEPACGNGNFLVPLLKRKFAVVERKCGKNPDEFFRLAIAALSSIYGIDILPDNVAECRERLLDVFDQAVANKVFKKANVARQVAQFILEKNIVCGDALSLKTESGAPIVFSEWSPIMGKMVRRDFAFEEIILAQSGEQPPECLFNTGNGCFIPRALQEHKPVPYLQIIEVDNAK